jgi:putative sterol carrier protein|tara:strand:+ start:593 stop:964 length:372 start_codon:yes stop_codon:yes gene_type:complete
MFLPEFNIRHRSFQRFPVPVTKRNENMSDIITEAVAALREKIDGEFDGSAKFEIEGEGSVVVDGAGVREGSDGDETEVTLTADADTFREILSGELNPTSAFMGGRLKLDGDMGTAMRLAGHLS